MPKIKALYPGRSGGIQAAMMPIETSQERQCQLFTLVHVVSELTFCPFPTVRTMQHAAVLLNLLALLQALRLSGTNMRPRLIKTQRPAFTRIAMWTFHNKRIRKSARTTSEMMEMMAWEIMIRCNCASAKHLAGIFFIPRCLNWGTLENPHESKNDVGYDKKHYCSLYGSCLVFLHWNAEQ